MTRTFEPSLITAKQQMLAAGQVLARAFSNDPLCVYTQPDRNARISQFTWFFTELALEGARRQGVYGAVGSDGVDGVAIWAPCPSRGEPVDKHVAARQMDLMEQRFGAQACHRFTTTYRYFEDIHHVRMPDPHWYLALLGVAPERQGRGIGRALLTAGLRRADEENVPCYLETFVPNNVPFYESCGLSVVDAGLEPRSQIPFWAMRREPGQDGPCRTDFRRTTRPRRDG